MIQDNTKSEKLERIEYSNNLLKKLAVNFENIKKIDRAIASEFEKRLAFAEDSVKFMLNDSADSGEDFSSVFALFDMLFDAENANLDSFFVGEHVIRENIFLCEYLFRCIDSSHRIAEYMKYYSEMQNKRAANIGDFIEKIEFDGYRKKNADIKINLSDKLTFNKLMSYLNLCDFQIMRLNYDSGENTVHLTADIQNKNFLFNVFIGLIRYYKVAIDIIG